MWILRYMWLLRILCYICVYIYCAICVYVHNCPNSWGDSKRESTRVISHSRLFFEPSDASVELCKFSSTAAMRLIIM